MKLFYVCYTWPDFVTGIPKFKGLTAEFEGPTADEIFKFAELMTKNSIREERVTVVSVTPLTGY